MNPEELREHLRAVCDAAGSQKLWAHAHEFSQAYVSDVIRGRSVPSPKLLKVLGLKKVVTYVEVNSGVV